jgi:hypothetical protein
MVIIMVLVMDTNIGCVDTPATPWTRADEGHPSLFSRFVSLLHHKNNPTA